MSMTASINSSNTFSSSHTTDMQQGTPGYACLKPTTKHLVSTDLATHVSCTLHCMLTGESTTACACGCMHTKPHKITNT
jgi:hypothetical protein